MLYFIYTIAILAVAELGYPGWIVAGQIPFCQTAFRQVWEISTAEG